MILPPKMQRWAADIRWFFHSADGAMGLKSNFMGMVASLEGGGPSSRVAYEVDDRRLVAAERARLISRALELTPGWARVVIGLLCRTTDGEDVLLGALISTTTEHRRSRTKRPVKEWLERTRCSSSAARRMVYIRLDMEAAHVAGEALGLYAKAYNSLTLRSRHEGDQLAGLAEGR